MSDSDIKAFFSCKRCVTAGRRSKISAGLIEPTTARIWCATCNSVIVDLALLDPMPMRCDVCGREVTDKGHVH